MSMIILKPSSEHDAYSEAAEVFKKMYKSTVGKALTVTENDDGASDLVIIGSDAVNDFLMNEMFEGRISLNLGIRYGTDDYCIKSCQSEGRNFLILAGGRGRSTLYAVYDFFERFAGCHYFWDGDVIPHSDSLCTDNINIVESPRFEYRGLRYFAHRGLKRFQAEHWSFDDWKQEIDWMVKKRLNFFMLRIGMDDVWQRAFPDVVSYPDEFQNIEGYKDYDDRSDFWTLKYRGELRERVLDYARLLDLDYPVDCGTMTHWYSRTPQEFLEKVKPTLLVDNHYGHNSDTGKVWDFRIKENIDNYMRLTETMVENYEKRCDMFHTIGLGERKMFKDPHKNFSLKLFAYRRIAENIRKRYPNSKLLLASWDFVGWWKPEEVKALVQELDPERTLILDYTSDTNNPESSFLNWGIVGEFPWIFGLFHAYESESELRGAYDRMDERLRVAAEDPYCKGMILWPELSHSDPLILEYLTANAWNPLEKSLENITETFCKNRYRIHTSELNECWQKLLSFIKLGDWGGYSNNISVDDELYVERCPLWQAHSNIWTGAAEAVNFICENEKPYKKFYTAKIAQTVPTLPDAVSAIRQLANINAFNDPFVLRDSIDITQTVLSRMLNFLLATAIFNVNNRQTVQVCRQNYLTIIKCLADVLSLSSDYSIYYTLEAIKKTAPVNPRFELTLKHNICCGYCEQPAVELIYGRFIEEAEITFDWLLAENRGILPKPNADEIINRFFDTPLEELQPVRTHALDEVLHKAASAVEGAIKILT